MQDFFTHFIFLWIYSDQYLLHTWAHVHMCANMHMRVCTHAYPSSCLLEVRNNSRFCLSPSSLLALLLASFRDLPLHPTSIDLVVYLHGLSKFCICSLPSHYCPLSGSLSFPYPNSQIRKGHSLNLRPGFVGKEHWLRHTQSLFCPDREPGMGAVYPFIVGWHPSVGKLPSYGTESVSWKL